LRAEPRHAILLACVTAFLKGALDNQEAVERNHVEIARRTKMEKDGAITFPRKM